MTKDWEIEFVKRRIKNQNWWLEQLLPFLFSNNELIDVGMSEHAITSPTGILYTDNLMECLGVALYDKESGKGTLAHIMAGQHPEEDIKEMLSELNPLHYSKTFACIAGEWGPPDLPNSRRIRDFLTKTGIFQAYIEVGGDDRRALCLYPRSASCYVINESKRTFKTVNLNGKIRQKYVMLPSQIIREPIRGVYDYG
jgi:hypothetical protein